MKDKNSETADYLLELMNDKNSETADYLLELMNDKNSEAADYLLELMNDKNREICKLCSKMLDIIAVTMFVCICGIPLSLFSVS